MDDYAGRVLADRYRLPLPPSDEPELAETRAFDTYSGQEVLVRQVPLPEVVEAEVLGADGLPDGFVARDGGTRRGSASTTRRPTEPAVRRAIEAAQAAAQIPDHPRLDQVFDVFAEGGSLWVVSELVPARSLAALLAEKPLSPYRAAEVAADVLAALRVLHAHGWVHRNITERTVLICDDGRVMLTGLAAGAAEEALCGYDPVPVRDFENDGAAAPAAAGGGSGGSAAGAIGAGARPGGSRGVDPEAARRAAIEARAQRGGPLAEVSGAGAAAPVRRALEAGGEVDVRAARAGAIAAYRAGARAAARVHEQQRGGQAALPGPRPAGADATAPPGQIADPYGVAHTNSWNGSQSRTWNDGADTGQGRPALTGAGPTGSMGSTGATQVGGWDELVAGGAPGASPAETAVAATPGSAAGTAAGHGVRTSAENGVGTAVEHTVGTGVGTPPRRGPATALDAERARQARMNVVGPVTERWAPEQAGPVHENWQLAAPIGPATDLWALGALLFRAVQGHAPYPEENTAELVQLVCAEPPAFAEECGPLRPVVESLLRQDPTERLDFEELNGWLRSLVRSAPEPEAGAHVIAAPPVDPRRLPIVRRRGELVRRRRAGLPATSAHARHKRSRHDRSSRSERSERPDRQSRLSGSSGSSRPSRSSNRPRSLGRNLLLLLLLLLVAAVAYAVLFMPKAESGTGAGDSANGAGTGAAGDVSPAPGHSSGTNADGGTGSEPRPDQTSPGSDDDKDKSPSGSSGSTKAQTSDPDVAQGFALRKDAAGFRIAVADGWSRTPKNGHGQVVYSHGDFELIVVPGRDSTDGYGSDPLTYQREREQELQPFRDSTWATSTGMRRIDVGGRTMAEGQFTWQDSSGHELYVRNLALIVDGHYHVVQVRGPEAERDEVTRLYEQASSTYQVTG
ncbi:protein kinase [Streptomyces sp. NPDC005485]|uniref:protein kinase domain-containing protein n=1 Tax=Streptomyces sp. NPDC005485 TaxID=3155591 RepID=UPI0033AE40DC